MPFLDRYKESAPSESKFLARYEEPSWLSSFMSKAGIRGKLGIPESFDIREQIGGLAERGLELWREKTEPEPLRKGAGAFGEGGDIDVILSNIRKQALSVPRFPIDIAQQVFFDEEGEVREPAEVGKAVIRMGGEFAEYGRQNFENYATYISPLSSPAARRRAIESIAEDPLGLFFCTAILKGGIRGAKRVKLAVERVIKRKTPLVEDIQPQPFKRAEEVFPKEQIEEVLGPKPKKIEVGEGKKILALKRKLKAEGVGEKPAQAIPRGWKIEVQPNWRKSSGWRSEVDWRDKRIVFESAADAADPAVLKHEIAHIRIGELPDITRESLLSEYAKTAKRSKWEVEHGFHQEKMGMDYGEYLTDPNRVSPEIRAVFDKYLTEQPTPAPAGKGIPKGKKVAPAEYFKHTARGKDITLEALKPSEKPFPFTYHGEEFFAFREVIHKYDKPATRKWQVTHKASGRRITQGGTSAKSAIELAKARLDEVGASKLKGLVKEAMAEVVPFEEAKAKGWVPERFTKSLEEIKAELAKTTDQSKINRLEQEALDMGYDYSDLGAEVTYAPKGGPERTFYPEKTTGPSRVTPFKVKEKTLPERVQIRASLLKQIAEAKKKAPEDLPEWQESKLQHAQLPVRKGYMPDLEKAASIQRVTFKANGATYTIVNTKKHLAAFEEQVKGAYPVRGVVTEYPELGKKGRIERAKIEKKRREVEPFAGKAELPRPTEPSTPQEILKKSEIIKSLREKLEIPVRTGRFRERAKGIYKRREQIVRLKNATDLPTLSHEIGHHIEEIIFPKAPRRLEQIRKYQKEVIALTREAGFPKRLQTRAEGFAEFIRLYITDPKQAQAKTPKFYAHFEGKMTGFPELQDILLGARRDIQRWVNQPATAKVLSQVSVAAKEPSDVSINRIYTMTVDDLRPIQVAVKEMSGGRLPRDIANDPFRQAWLLRGWTGKANAFLDYGIMDKAGNKIFPSFKEILKPVAGDLDAFRTYGVAKRALERRRRGFETGIDPRDASASLAELSKKSPTYEKTFNQLVEFQDKVLEYLSESGVVGAGELGKLRQASKDYLPFYRVFEETKVKGFRTGRGIANLADPVKRFRGSGREIVDPLESIIKNVYAMVSIAERNKVASTLVNLAGKTKGGGKWVEALPTPQKGWQFKLGEIEKFLAEAGAEGVDAETIARIFRPSIFAPAKENILTVFRHGKPKFYQVQPDLYRALLALDQESSGVLVRILSKPARMLRAGATLTPEFSLYRNPFRDQMTAFIYSKYGYRPGIDLARGLFHAIKKDDLFWKWQSSGGAHASLVSLDRNYLQGALRRVLRQKTTQIAKDVVVHPIETLRALSEFTEEATRIGEFKRGLEKGASLREAALASRDVTLDFARVGAKGRIPNQLIAFFNAQVQGIDKMVRSFKENPTRSTVKAVAGITVPSLILYAFNRDNPRYKELPTWRKDLFWNIPLGDRFISIPKPFELGIIFGSFPERLFEWVDTQDPEAFDDLAGNFWQSLTPSVLPTALQPIVEVAANRSFFTGRPVVSEGRKRLIPSEQYSPYTPETFKAVGGRLGISPAKLEHVYRGYTAGLGRIPVAGMEKLFFNPPERPSDIAYTPMLRGIVTPEPTGFRSKSVDRFYDFKEKVNRLNATWKTLSGDEARTFREKHPEIKWNSAANKRGRVLSDLRKRRQRIMDDPNITVEEKKRRIEPIDKQVIKLVQGFLKRINP